MIDKPYWLSALAAILIACAAGAQAERHAAERHALLVGVGQYLDLDIEDLEGPSNDVSVLRQLLLDRWGFTADHITTLVDGAATRAAILEALQNLPAITRPGDHVFIYFSSHGTSAHDFKAPELGRLVPDESGAFLAYDFPASAGTPEDWRRNLIIGRRDLRPVLLQLDQGERQVFIAADSCFSGNAVRALFSTSAAANRLVSRHWRPRGRTRAAFDSDLGGDVMTGTRQPTPYPYRNVLFIAAASDSEEAKDIPGNLLPFWPTLSARPQGAFSDALGRVLSGEQPADLDGDGLSYGELFAGIKTFMDQRAYRHTPRLLPELHEDLRQLTSSSAFGNPRAVLVRPKPAQPAALRVQLDAAPAAAQQALQALPGLELVGQQPDVIVRWQQDEALLLSGAEDLIARLPGADAEAIVARVRQALWLHQLLATVAATAPPFELRFELRGGGVARAEGSVLEVDIQANQAMHLLLVNVNSQGSLDVLYPYNVKELTAVPADTLISFPSPGGEIFVKPPFGTDHLLAVGFTQPPVALLEQLQQFARNDAPLPPDSPLFAELAAALKNGHGGYALAMQKFISVPAPEKHGQ